MAMNATRLATAIKTALETLSGGSCDLTYLEEQAQAIIDEIENYYSGGAGTSNHSALDELDYASAGHTGFQPTLGYTPEDEANKDTDPTMASDSDTLYPSQKAVKEYIDTALGDKEDVSNKSANTSLGTSDTLYPTQKAVKEYVDTVTSRAVSNSLTAYAGGGQANATSLTKGINIITTCATQFDSVKLPSTFVEGDEVIVKNIGSKQSWVYPNTDHTIESLSANTGVGLLPNNSLTFIAISNTAWSLITGQIQLSHQQNLTVSGTGLTQRRAVGKIELETLTNILRLKDYNISMTRASGSALTAMTFTILGVVFKTIAGNNWQAGYGDSNGGGGAVVYSQPIGNTNTIIQSQPSANVLSYSLGGSAELDSQTLL